MDDDEQQYWSGVAIWQMKADNDDMVWVRWHGWTPADEAEEYGGASDVIDYSLDLEHEGDGNWTAIVNLNEGLEPQSDVESGLDVEGLVHYVGSYDCPVSSLVEGLRQEGSPELATLAEEIRAMQ